MGKSFLERVVLHWYAVPNENKTRGGWMPVYDYLGKVRGDTYGKGHDLEIALKMARADAEEEASRFVGDWDVVVERKPGFGEVTKQKRPRKPSPASRPVKERDDLPSPKQLDTEVARVLASMKKPKLAALFADPRFTSTLRAELQARKLSQVTSQARASRPFTVKSLVQEHPSIYGIYGTYAEKAEAAAKADALGGWVEHEGRVIHGRDPRGPR